MITGGDAKVRPPPKFGFAFRQKADAASVRLIGLLNEAASAAEKNKLP